MVTKGEVFPAVETRYRLATVMIWVGGLTWNPFIVMRILGNTPSIFWFLPFHLIGVVGGSRMKALARREMGALPPQKTRLRTLGYMLIILGILVWMLYFSLKLIFQVPVEVVQLLPYHLAAVLSGIALLLVNFLVLRRKSNLQKQKKH